MLTMNFKIAVFVLLLLVFSNVHVSEGSLYAIVNKDDLNKYRSKSKSYELDVRGPLPFNEEVTMAIQATCKKLLESQKDDGSWDMVDKKRRGLDQTADDAVDSVVMTSLCAMSLRSHHEVDPQVINNAVNKALHFVMDRINRGRLSTTVMYACWRYTFGLQFLKNEHTHCKDSELKKKIHHTASLMVDSLLSMQLITRGKESSVVKYRKPSNLGLSVINQEGEEGVSAIVTDVVKNGSADLSGIKKGDRIVSINAVKINNLYDYYSQEINFFDGDVLTFQLVRKGELIDIEVTVLPQYPGSLGFTYSNSYDKKGEVLVDGFEFLSDADDSGVEEGDVIVSFNGKDIHSESDMEAFEGTFYSGHKVKMKIKRESEIKDIEFSLVPVPSSNFRIELQEDDKSGKDGVQIKNFYRNSSCKSAGIEIRDRILKVDHIPVMGRDHFNKIEASLWEFKLVDIEVLKDNVGSDKDPKIIVYSDVKLNSKTAVNKSSIRGYHGINLSDAKNAEAIVVSLDDSSPAAKAGLLEKDVIQKVNGKTLKTSIAVHNALFQNTTGNKITLIVKRAKKELTINFVMGRQPSPWAVKKEEYAGGWNYYAFVGGSNTFVTASVLRTLMAVKKDMDINIPEKNLKQAYHVLKMARLKGQQGRGDTYTYDIAKRGPDKDFRGHLGRSNAAELAALQYCDNGFDYGDDKREELNLNKSLQLWLEHRSELDRVRNFKGTHDRAHYNNAAYYWMYSHRTTAFAANYITDKKLKKEVKETILKALMLTIVKEESAWYGHSSFGALNGTAQALITLGELKDLYNDNLILSHPKLQTAMKYFKLAQYGEAYCAAMIAKVSNDVVEGGSDKELNKEADQLIVKIQKRYDSSVSRLSEQWNINPFDALYHANNHNQFFTGHPNQVLLSNLIERWEEDPAIPEHIEYVNQFTALNKKHQVAINNPFLKKIDAKKIVAEYQKHINKKPTSDIAKQAIQIIDNLNQSFNNKGVMGVDLDRRYDGVGVRISIVRKDGAASKAKLRPRDVILEIDGKKIKNDKTLRDVMKSKKPEDEVLLKLKRKNTKDFEIVLILGRQISR